MTLLSASFNKVGPSVKQHSCDDDSGLLGCDTLYYWVNGFEGMQCLHPQGSNSQSLPCTVMIACCSASGLFQEQDMQLQKYTISISVACGFLSHRNLMTETEAVSEVMEMKCTFTRLVTKKFVFRLCILWYDCNEMLIVKLQQSWLLYNQPVLNVVCIGLQYIIPSEPTGWCSWIRCRCPWCRKEVCG